MTIAGLLAATVAAIAAAGEGGRGKESLQGTWTWVAYEEAGAKATPDQMRDWTMRIKRDTLVLQGPSDLPKIEATIRLDAGTAPRQIDLIYATPSAPRRGRSNSSGSAMGPVPTAERATPGIYRLDGDTLRVCLAARGSTRRPAKFDGSKDSGAGVYVFKRKK
ncbi:MAG TPA: TIGR03067 domain-containing protein [Isosphaeraceae bacterium]|nr:TIGR03067 domain-containing protein [Isosphaeraceae bacterium]